MRMGQLYSRFVGTRTGLGGSVGKFLGLYLVPSKFDFVAYYIVVGIVSNSAPNPPLNSDPARTAFRSFSSSRFLGSARRLGAGGAG